MADNKSSIYIEAKSNIKNVASQIKASLGVISTGVGKLGGSLKELTGSTAKIAGVATALAGVGVSFASIRDLYGHGLKVNIDTSQALNGTAGIVASLYEISDANGNVLQGQDRFNASVELSRSLIKQLRIDALRTGASFKDLRDGFQAAVGSATANGFSLQQTREITTLIANAGKSMGLDSSQIAQESRALLSNNITSDAQIGSALISDKASKEAYKNALKVGEGYDFLLKKLQQFEYAGISQANTLGGAFDALGDIYDLFTGQAASQLESNLGTIQKTINAIVEDNGDINKAYNGMINLLDTIGGYAGSGLASTFEEAFAWIRDFGTFIDGDQTSLNQLEQIGGNIKSAFSGLGEIISSTAGTALDLVGYLSGAVLETDKMSASASGLSQFLSVVQKIIGTINLGIYAMVQGFQTLFKISKAQGSEFYYDITTYANTVIDSIGGAFKLVDTNVTRAFGNNLKNIASTNQQMLDLDYSINKEEQANMGIDTSKLTDPNYVDEMWNKTYEDIEKKRLEIIDSINQSQNKSNDAYLKAKNDRMEKEAKEIIDGAIAERYKLKSLSAGGDDDKKSRGVDAAKYAYEQSLKLLERSAEKEKNIYDDLNKNLDLDYSQNLLSMKDFYSKKNQQDKAHLDNQVSIINQEIELTKKRLEEQKGYQVDASAKNADRLEEKKLKDVNDTNDKLNELYNERDKLQKEFTFNTRKETFEQAEALRKYAIDVQDIADKIAELNGSKTATRDSSLSNDLYDMRQKYQQDPAALALVDQYESATKRQYAYNDALEKYNDILDQQSTLEERISIYYSNGKTSELDQMLQLRDVRKEYVDKLKEQYEIQMKINEGSTDPAVINALEKVKNKIIELEQTFDPFANKIDSLIGTGLTDAMTEFATGAKTAKEAFGDFIDSITEELTRLANQQVVQMLAKGFFGTDANGNQANSFGNIISGFFGSSSNVNQGASTGWLSSIGSAISGFFGGARATGGSVGYNKSYLVGENGPEIFTPKMNGTITNNSLSSRMSGNGGTVIQNINVHTPNYTSFQNSDGQIGAQMSSMLRRSQRNL